MTMHKAVASGIVGTLVAFLTGVATALMDNSVNVQEWVSVALATVIGAGASFGVIYSVPNQLKD